MRTAGSNFVFTGPDGIADLYCQREAWGVASVWVPTQEERAAIAGGANILLCMMTQVQPPVSLVTTPDVGVGDDAPDVRARLEALKRGDQ